MLRKSLFSLLAFTLILTACDQAPQTPAGPSEEEVARKLEADKAAIQELIDGYEAAIAAGDAAACTAMFAPDAIFMPDGIDPVSGNGIEDWYQELADLDGTLAIDFDISQLEIHHDWAFVRSDNTGTATTEDGTNTFHSKSAYLLARQSDGNWKVKAYIFDDIEPEGEGAEGEKTEE